MRKELDDALVRDFPRLYRHRNPRGKRRRRGRVDATAGTVMGEPIAHGFEVLDGWEPLLRRLSAALEPYAAELGIAATQVKEKLGGLRFDLGERPAGGEVAWATIDRAIERARRSAARTCEPCGAPGELRAREGWLGTRCDACWHGRPTPAGVTRGRRDE